MRRNNSSFGSEFGLVLSASAPGNVLMNTIPTIAASDIERLLYKTLKKYWGYDEFRPNQLEACKYLIQGKDCFLSMATGTGKSLTFQLPAVALKDSGIPCVGIVISPLLSLIEDQVSALLAMQIPAVALNSSTPLALENMAMNGDFTLIYTTPEKIVLWRHGLEKLRSKKRVVTIAIDESHCVSEWGYEFRPEYRQLNCIRSLFGVGVPIVALTASATPLVEVDIIKNLQLNEPIRLKSSLNRPNLKYSCIPRSSTTDIIRVILQQRTKQLQSYSPDVDPINIPYQNTLIYVNSRKSCEEIANELVSCTSLNGVKVAFYHAGMQLNHRNAVHQAFLRDEIQIIVSTTAFGMGKSFIELLLTQHSFVLLLKAENARVKLFQG